MAHAMQEHINFLNTNVSKKYINIWKDMSDVKYTFFLKYNIIFLWLNKIFIKILRYL